MGVVGLWQMVEGMILLNDGAMIAMRIYQPSELSGRTMQTYFVAGTFRIVVGFFVMCGFPAFDRMAFPRRRRRHAEGDEKSSD